MKNSKLYQRTMLWIIAAFSFIHVPNAAAVTSTDFQAAPALVSQAATPQVMLAMSVDHQLFFKAYSDYQDLDGDGAIDTSYNHSFDYYGYFDSYKCYSYSSKRFDPVSLTADKYCSGSQWSGNFLNWASMTRIDTVRRILYGGLRSTDTASVTILERSYLPNDAHSFAKYFSDTAELPKLTPFTASNAPSGITICNTTVSSTTWSQYVTDAPLMRVAKGDYALWSANERWQCRWNEEKAAASGYNNGNDSATSGLGSESSSPSRVSQGLGEVDYVARVKVCDSSLIGTEDCKQYPDGNYKPVGVLQSYGDEGAVDFGLLSGSYSKNKSGGVLRKNISSIVDEVNATTDGTFKTAPADGNIIDTLNNLRLYGYSHDSGTYNENGSGDDCEWGKNSFNNGKCTNWGNPVAEILSECYRYYGGEKAESDFVPSSSGPDNDLGLQAATWDDPLDAINQCAKLNLIMFNASTVSYDSDELNSFDKDFSAKAEELTDSVGDGEGITGNDYFVGESGSDDDQLCTSKTIDALGDVKGTCPDSPRLEGSYQMAGVSAFAHLNDLRSDLDGVQSVDTYGVSLAPAIPSVDIQAAGSSGKTVTLLPACRNDDAKGNCAIVDFKIAEAYHQDTANPGEYIGTLYVNWEDSEQGGDFDQDMWGTIRYRITASEIEITTDAIAQSTPYDMGFGYIISGTTNDGFHVHSGINGFKYDETKTKIDCKDGCSVGDVATTRTYTLGTSDTQLLKQPLFYAAKWGGFTDADNSGTPNSDSEWDNKNNADGSLVPDGIPDNYFYATDPSQLKYQLQQVLDSIINRISSGTNASLVSNSNTGVGAIYQALYQPSVKSENRNISWVGILHSLFMDGYGRLREDSNANDQLDSADKAIDIYYDASLEETLIQRYTVGSDNELTVSGAPVDIDEIQTVWNARDQLAAINNGQTRTQRTYGNNDGTRYILTAIDGISTTADGKIDNADVVDFIPSTFTTANRYQYLGDTITTSALATDLVNYIRGDDSVTGMRSRTIDFDGDGADEVWRLGDIIHSTPSVVGAPSSNYKARYGDSSYDTFWEQYEYRRQMVYSGANDGMLHAFNGGFWNLNTLGFDTAVTGKANHKLGAEMWAYVPYNLLPHLRWLGEQEYPHVYYVDGETTTFDANIFSDDSDHPGGWGTVLVVGMRMGGGEQTLSIGGDSTNFNSAFLVFDVTNPEVPPSLIAEISHADMGLTTSKPAVLKRRVAKTDISGSPDWSLGAQTNEWYLVMGSGPIGAGAIEDASSDQNAKLFVYDLVNKEFVSGATGLNIESDGHSYLGDITVVDWDSDFVDDVIYVGSVSLDPTDMVPADSVSGNLNRVVFDPTSTTFTPSRFVKADKPIVAAPYTILDSNSQPWVYSGTGRVIIGDDNRNSEQQSFYGVKESMDSSGNIISNLLERSDLIDSTNTVVFENGMVKDYASGSAQTLTIDSTDITSFSQLKTQMESESGWYLDFENTTNPSGRNVNTSVSVFSFLFFTEYIPPENICDIDGESFLYALDYQTGTASYLAPFGTTYNRKVVDAQGDDVPEAQGKVSLGDGMASAPVIHRGVEGVTHIITQKSTGAIGSNEATVDPEGGRMSWRQLY
ncbi:PilC/PilY family type IV pilus protein [Amphritea sp. 1_MG-2023]|uniref:pilus assembly protein n=1 Tax=Amphritea sp. 1_MG-2023 TaxID=3062670 RepID=UPI0026E28B45|nr:PilC/PilY family type IV pilus protein [Amphritea sp. 1_MG-2023]MDO6563628.1 PilC/PilY family type IV pilus protein [Amphritea sp. 1_MG-2023]